MVEAQGKGTLHAHGLIWLNGHLSPQTLRDKLSESGAFRKSMITWLEDTIKCEMLDPNKNTCPATIPKRDGGEPHPGTIPAPTIATLSPNDFRRDYSQFVDRLLREYNWHVHQPGCWKYLKRGEPKSDENCRMGMTGKTTAETIVDPETFAISLRRLHPWIANYNDVMVFLLKCNMDIKFVGSGQAAKAFLYYVTDYITKPPLSVHLGLAALAHAISVTNTKFPDFNNPPMPTRNTYTSVMTSTVNSMMGHQEISHPQVMSYLIGGGDHYKSDSFALLWWGAVLRSIDKQFPTRTDSRGASESDTQELPAVGAEPEVSLTLGDGTISASNQLMDYMFRCREPEFEKLCLYEF
ncbi:hypothetical protein C8R46DRAFT_879467, partial [Mycena filopes]